MTTKRANAVTKAAARAAAENVPAVKKEEDTRLAEYGGLMDETPIDSRDFLIPKLLLMQSTSTMVKEEKARAGEIRGSIDWNKVTEKEGSVEIIPFAVYKTWVTVKKKGNEYIGQVPMTLANASKPREEIVDGEEVVNYETLNYYCLLPHEIATGVFLPYVVSFRSTSYLAGKTLETHRARLKEFGKPLCFKTFTLGCKQRENEHGKFYIYTIAEARDTLDAELSAVKHWNGVVKSGQARVDESAESKVSDAPEAGSDKVQSGEEY